MSVSGGSGFRWTVVVLTCQHKDSVYSFQRELESRQKRGSLPPSTLLLTLSDRQQPLGSGGATLNALLVAAEHLSNTHGYTVVTADVLDEAHILILHTGRDFPFSPCSRAFCWVGEQRERVEGPWCCVDVILDLLTRQICPGSPPGVWVCSTDMIPTIPPDFSLSWQGFSGVCVLALPGDVSYAANHGVYLTDTQGNVRDIIYRGTEEQIKEALMHDGKVPLVSGPVFFDRIVSEKLLQTHVSPPLDGCTYLGLDSGAPPLQMSLFLDILKCLCVDQTQEQFVSEERLGCSSPVSLQGAAVLWRILRGHTLTMAYVPGGCYDYLTLSGKQHVQRLSRDWSRGDAHSHSLSHIQNPSLVQGRVINSVLEGDVVVATGAVVQHCHLQGPVHVPSGCLLSGLESSQPIRGQLSDDLTAAARPTRGQLSDDLTAARPTRGQLGDDIIVQQHRIELGELRLKVFSVIGANDDLQMSSEDSSSSFLNHSWRDFYSRTGIQPEELWFTDQPRCLLEARLFPAVLQPAGGAVGPVGGAVLPVGGAVQPVGGAVLPAGGAVLPAGGAVQPAGGAVQPWECVVWLMGGDRDPGYLRVWRSSWRLSLKEVMSLTHQEVELGWREQLQFLAGRRRVEEALESRSDVCLMPVFRAAVLGGQQDKLLETLDQIAAGSRVGDRDGSKPGSNLGVSARCLSCIADVLVLMAGGRGGLRSGPAANRSFGHAYFLLEAGDLRGGVDAMATQRKKWLDRPDLLVRAARHYEGAGQILLRQAVMSSQSFISIGRTEAPLLGQWQEVECPARLDLAGGWSDTPPIAFEHGGSVTNVSVRVDGERPIGARARRIASPRILLVGHTGGRDTSTGVAMETVCESLDDLRDYCQPNAPGALLKAVCVCSGLVSLSSHNALQDQLMDQWGGGIEIHSWSLLPTGSGMGTSSILAGALLAAVYRCTGQTYDSDSLIHAVLYLEQILTTGGGWQDQVGGLVGGVKVGRSRASLPVQVTVERLEVSEDFLVSLEKHLLLVYTGKTRLARNLLQDVVRSWYSRLPSMVQNVQQLVANSEDCAKACVNGSLSGLGECLDRSWQQKKIMAPGCEPASVRTMMEVLKPLVLGQSLAGAGGGGFLYVLTREPLMKERVRQVLSKTQGLGDFSVHSVEVDMEGIHVVAPS